MPTKFEFYAISPPNISIKFKFGWHSEDKNLLISESNIFKDMNVKGLQDQRLDIDQGLARLIKAKVERQRAESKKTNWTI